MREKQGYFSLVQYSEVPERAEFINVGVVLFSPAARPVLSRFVDRPVRAERLFKFRAGAHFSRVIQSLKSRLEFEFADGWNKDRVDKFISMRTGKLRLLSARSVYVENDTDVISTLFKELVGENRLVKHGPRARTRLREKLSSLGVEKLLDKPEPVILRSGVEVKADYGYQNGFYNLIKGIDLDGSPDHALGKVSPHMIEGRMLFDATRAAEKKRLVMVCDVADQSDVFVRMIKEQMADHSVAFYDMADISPLADDVMRNVAFH